MIAIKILSGSQRDKIVKFEKEIANIGRAPSNDLIFDEPFISGEHAQIYIENNALTLRDLNSTNGSFIFRNNKFINITGKSEKILGSDTIYLGSEPNCIKLSVYLEITASPSIEMSKTIIAKCFLNELSKEVPAQFCALLRFNQETAGIFDLEKISEISSNFLFSTFPSATNFQFFIKEMEKDGSLFEKAFIRNEKNEIKQTDKTSFSKTLTDYALSNNTAVLIKDIPSKFDPSKSLVSVNVMSGMIAPIKTKNNYIGILEISNRMTKDAFADNELTLFALFSSYFVSTIENVLLVKKLSELNERLRLENIYFAKDNRIDGKNYEIIGKSKPMQDIYDKLTNISTSDAPVLIEGETGTGKELIARKIHLTSKRKERSFIPVNCSAFSPNLLESELFGHVKGSFTGAISDKKGIFEIANGGTIFLDEITDMPSSMQAKLLRVLEDGVFYPVGAERPKKVNVRIISATNKLLSAEIEKENFRRDLFYRLNVFAITLPALRQRKDDIEPLIDYFLERESKRLGRNIIKISDDAKNILKKYSYPGNIRELENEIKHLIAITKEGEEIKRTHLTAKFYLNLAAPQTTMSATSDLKSLTDNFEKNIVEQYLKNNNGNQSQTAKILGISRQALIKKMKKLGIS